MYHYVRPVEGSRFPRLHALEAADFARQVAALGHLGEPATLESALAFLAGEYRPARPLIVLTFDDGLRDHVEHVLPVLRRARWQGLFFLATGCLAGRVPAVHKSHFLMAELGPERYPAAFRRRLLARAPEYAGAVDAPAPTGTYRWDTPDVARFKYLVNFVLPAATRDLILDELFAETLGDEAAFARELYLTWDEARAMQQDGMVLGGHSHGHAPLASLGADGQREELARCHAALERELGPHPGRPFAYPYGKPDTFDDETVTLLQAHGTSCAFATTVGGNAPGADPFRLARIDPKDVPS